MAKTISKIAIVTILAVLLVVLCVIVSTVWPAQGAQAAATQYISGSLSFTKPAYGGSGYDVVARVWLSDDNDNWQSSTLDAAQAEVRYYNEAGEAVAKPTAFNAVGSNQYTVKIVLKSDATVSYMSETRDLVAPNGVIASLSYRVVDEDVYVVFAPSNDIDFDDADHKASIVNGTKAYQNGADITDQCTIAVKFGEEDATKVQNPGTYHVTVTYNDKTYTSTFAVRLAVKDIVSLASTPQYEGMHTNYNRSGTTEQVAKAKADMLANRTAYYTPKFSGKLTDGGAIAAAYDSKIDIAYYNGTNKLAAAPTEAGSYICRLTVTADIDEHLLKAGDYVDLTYTIAALPYKAVLASTGTLLRKDTGIYVRHRQSGFSMSIAQFELAADNTRLLEWSVATTEYYDADGNKIDPVSMPNGITEKGKYTVAFTIALPGEELGNHYTGANYFGDANAGFVLDSSNNRVEYEFEVIGSYEVTGIRSVYCNNKTPFAASYIQSQNNAVLAPTALNPRLAYSGSTLTNGTTEETKYFQIEYTYEGTPVTVEQIRTNQAVGNYQGTITFLQDWKANPSGTEVIVASKDETYHFSFAIVTAPFGTINVVKDNATEAGAYITSTLTSLGLQASDVSMRYYRVDNGLYAVCAASDLCETVGKYAVSITVNTGSYVNQVPVLHFTKQSAASVDTIAFTYAGLIQKAKNYDGTAVAAAVSFGNDEVQAATSYSVYYQKKQADSTWAICSLPVEPGNYRTVLRFNQPCAYFNAAYGTVVTDEFSIRALSLTMQAALTGDASVYDGTQKTATLTFYSNGKPIAVNWAYDVYYAALSAETPAYSSVKPLHAGNYAVGVVFTEGDLGCYQLSANDGGLSLEQLYEANNHSYTGYMVQSARAVTVERLTVDTVVTIPVGYAAMYDYGEKILPQYAFYRGNDQIDDDAKTLVQNIASQQLLEASVGNENPDADSFVVASSRTPFGSTIKEKDELPIETGLYDYLLTLKTGLENKYNSVDVVFGRVGVQYQGNPDDQPDYAVSATIVADSANTKLNTSYAILPLPVTIKALPDSFVLNNDIYAAYYGEAGMRSTDDLQFFTVTNTGASFQIVDPDLSQFVSIAFYKRLSGGSSLESTPAQLDELDLFAKGSYTLRVTFRTPNPDIPAESAIYSHYALPDGMATADNHILRADCYLDIAFDVMQAEPLRVVFDADFKSYAYSGTAKTFSIRMMSGEDDVTDLLAGTYKVSYDDYDESHAIGSAGADTQYTVKVKFLADNYHYYISQLVGTYSDEGMMYIKSNSSVSYPFTVTRSRVLTWGWNGGDSTSLEAPQSLYYSGRQPQVGLRFAVGTPYDVSLPTVTLHKGTDYDIWYYQVTQTDLGAQYTKLLTAPTMPGLYLAELILLRNLADYRAKIDTTYLSIYSYDYADEHFEPGKTVEQDGYCFGRSLAGSSSSPAVSENRYFYFSIQRTALTVGGLKASDKTFDNKDTAAVSSAGVLAVAEGQTGGAFVADEVQKLRALLAGSYVGQFASVGVGDAIAVYYRLHVAQGAVITMPHRALCANQDGAGLAYMVAQLQTLLDAQTLSEEAAATVADAIATLQEAMTCYDLYFADITASITPASITVLASNYSRVYEPGYDDTGKLQFTLSQSEFALLRTLLPSAKAVGDLFVGSLARADDDVEDINENGYRIRLGSLAFVSSAVTLSDGTSSRLGDLFALSVNRAYYYIRPCAITIGVEGDSVACVYGEQNPVVNYIVVAGALRDNDVLQYDGVSPVRDSKQAIDDVGTYSVLYTGVRVMRFGVDVTDNYRITKRPATFVIQPLPLVLRPEIPDNHYANDRFELGNVTVFTTDGVDLKPAELDTRFGAHLTYTFGRVEVPNTDETVYKAYKVTLGTIKVITQDNVDISANFTFMLEKSTKQYIVKKYVILLAVNGTAPDKSFGDADPSVPLKDYRDSLADLGFTLAEGSSPSRKAGEDVGTYPYLPYNTGSITVLDKDGNDVTKYCNISVYNGTGLLKEDGEDFVLSINPKVVTVTVRSETINRTGKSILPKIIYLDAEGKALSTALVSQMTAKYGIESNWEPIEGENAVTPIALNNEKADTNFNYKTKAGIINVVFPNNVVVVNAVSNEDALANENRFSFVGGVLYRTMQLYATNTLNGDEPNRTVTVTLPATDAMYGEQVYLIAVRRDGSYVMLNAQIEDGNITIEDDSFYYILAAKPQYWPYWLLGGIVLLAVVAVVAMLLHARNRTKVMGKKERAPKPAREKKKKAPKTVVPTAAETDSAQEVTATEAPQADEAAQPETQPAKKGKKTKSQTTSDNGKKKKRGNAPVGYTPSAVAPSSKYVPSTATMAETDSLPADVLPPAEDENVLPADTLPTMSDTLPLGQEAAADDDVVLGSNSGMLGASTPADSGVDDDEIIIATTSRRSFADDTDDGSDSTDE